MSTRAIVIVLVMVGLLHPLLCGAAGSNEVATDSPASRTRNYFDHIASRDVIIEGHVAACDTGTWIPQGPCYQKSSPQHVLNVTVKVDKVLAGTVPSRQTHLRTLVNQDVFAGATPGRRVIAWANRDECDKWQLWGSCILLDDDGKFQTGSLPPETSFGRGKKPHTTDVTEFERILRADRDPHQLAPFLNAITAARVRVIANVSSPNGTGFSCLVERLDVEPSSQAKTLAVDFAFRRDLYWRSPEVGDTLLIPLRVANATKVTLAGSPTHFRVKNQFIPLLGLRTALSNSAFDNDRGQLLLRPVQEEPAAQSQQRGGLK